MTQLKIGELAKRSGVSVRMLHHYDAIGLLTPAIRTGGDYRLYEPKDIARLHAIVALRQIGLSLKQVASVLQGQQPNLPQIIDAQLAALDHKVQQVSAMAERLRLLQATLRSGAEPEIGQWLSMVCSMTTYERYFSTEELQKLFATAKQTEPHWPVLIADIRAAMQKGLPATDLRLQPLARRWMDLSVRFAQRDFALMKRWEQMYLQEASARGKHGDDLATVHYINQVIAVRVAAWQCYFSAQEMHDMLDRCDAEWTAFAQLLAKARRSRIAPKSAKALTLHSRWLALVAETAGHNGALTQKYKQAFGANAVLRAGSHLGEALEQFVRTLGAPSSSPQKTLNAAPGQVPQAKDLPLAH